jgi:hypothetical protein
VRGGEVLMPVEVLEHPHTLWGSSGQGQRPAVPRTGWPPRVLQAAVSRHVQRAVS